jgi:hypothetical protein
VLLDTGVGAGAAAGGVHGWTVVVAAIVVVDIVAISVADSCCSWRKVAMLARCVFGDGCPGGSIQSGESVFVGEGGVLISASTGGALR